jgi:hypothetical protein
MNIEIETMIEAYTILKQYIPGKDRQEAADNLISIMVEILEDDDIKTLASTDAYLGRAYREYAPEDDVDEDLDSGYED